MSDLANDYTLDEVAAALRMSKRWLYARIAEGAEHERRGHKIVFTEAQVEKLRTANTKGAVPQSVTTGRKRRAS